MYAVIGEDQSDVNTLIVLIKRIANNNSVRIRGKGYQGCAEMLRKGAKQLALFSNTFKCNRFVVAYDCDKAKAADRFNSVVEKIIRPSGVNGLFCILVPIQELEAWILADLAAVQNVITSWVPTEIFPNPELVDDPKEEIQKLSRNSKRRPRYVHAMHNEQVAKYLNLDQVRAKCGSFEPLYDLVKNNKGNHP